MMSFMNDLSWMSFMKFRPLTIVLSGLDDFKIFKSIYLEWFWVGLESSKFRPLFWETISWLRVGSTVFSFLTLILNIEDDQTAEWAWRSSEFWPLSWMSRSMNPVPLIFYFECRGRSNCVKWAWRSSLSRPCSWTSRTVGQVPPVWLAVSSRHRQSVVML